MELTHPKHEAFAQHVASGLSYTEAAKRAGYNTKAAHNSGSRLHRLREVHNRIEELKRLRGGGEHVAGLRNSQARVTALEDRWERMRRIIVERAAHPDYAKVPGGRSGLLRMQSKTVGGKDKTKVVHEFLFDADLVREIRAHEQQAAEELGQWTSRRESVQTAIRVNLTNPKELNEALKDHMAQLPAKERRKIAEANPDLADVLDVKLPPRAHLLDGVTGEEVEA